MLHIILAILKFIGIVLTTILGMIVLLLCVVLFVPMRYRLEAESDGTLEGIEAKARVSWFFHLVSGYVIYKEEKVSWQMRILWKKLNVEKKETKKKTKNRKVKKIETAEQEITKEELKAREKEEVKREKLEIPAKEEKKQETSQNKKRKKKSRKKQNIFEKIKYTFQNICDKIKILIEKKEKLEEFISDAVHKAAFSRIKLEVVRLIRFLRPQKVKMNVHFGLEDPYQTGRVLAALSMLYPFYGEYMNVTPDFEERILEGDLFIKGHIHGIYAVIITWNLFFDKNFRTAYKHIKAFKF